MDEGSGTTLNDTIGSANLSSDTSDWVSGTGRGGFYLDFASADSAEETTNSLWENDTFAFLCWFNPDSTSEGAYLALGDSGGRTDFSMDAGGGLSGGFGIFVNNADGGSNVTIATPNGSSSEWNFGAATVDLSSNEIGFYHALASDTDVTKVGTGNYDTALGGRIDRFILGERSGDNRASYAGEIDNPAGRVGGVVSQSTIEKYFDTTKGDY
jgi:hypothetical protein